MNFRVPIVSVLIITYNHELFISQTIENVLNQVTNFDYEVIIANDYSTDKTGEVIEMFINSHPKGSLIKYFNHPKNIGMIPNLVFAIQQCRGKYIAPCEGDDYWTNELKLQKQFDFLESNVDCVLCHHWHLIAERNFSGDYIVGEAPTVDQGFYPVKKATIESIFSNKLRTKFRTIMFRNIIKEFPDWYFKVAYGDVPLSMILGKYGSFGFINEPMAVYRITNTGVSTAGSGNWLFTYNHFIEWIRIWEYGNLYYENKYRNEALITIDHFYKVIIKKYKYSLKIFCKMANYALLKSQFPVFLRLRVFSRLLSDFLIHKMKAILKNG